MSLKSESETISHSDVHTAWSWEQLALFRMMTPAEQLDAVKANALEHWIEDARNEALELLAGRKENSRKPLSMQIAKSRQSQFEQAAHPLISAPVKSPIFDAYIKDAIGSWLLIGTAVVIHFYLF